VNGRPSAAAADTQVELNEALWAQQDLLRHYTGRTLRPAEVMILVGYREPLAGRVLELGCGGGRLSGYLLELAQEFHGVDISPKMVAYCRQLYPDGTFEVRDLRDLSQYASASFEVVFASYNVLDVLDDAERRRVIAEIHRVLANEGRLIMSSHNLAYAPSIPRPTAVHGRDPLRRARELVRVPRRVRNHRRLRPLQRMEEDHAILLDDAHDYSVLHYYIERDVQERQLAELGFDLLDCLDLDGQKVQPGEQAPLHPELHYVARRLSPDQ
jgi:SAM-dependent methyltransferase